MEFPIEISNWDVLMCRVNKEFDVFVPDSVVGSFCRFSVGKWNVPAGCRDVKGFGLHADFCVGLFSKLELVLSQQ